MAKISKKKSLTSIATFIVVLLLAFAVLAAITQGFNNWNPWGWFGESDTKIINPEFSVGGLGSSGEYEETDKSIYTEKSFACQGLSVKLDDNSNINYQVFYYDNLDNFVSCSSIYAESMDIPEFLYANYARLVVSPVWDEDIEGFEKVIEKDDVSTYANQIEISVLKNQDLEFFRVSLDDTSYFTFTGGCYYSTTGVSMPASTYNSYSFVAFQDCEFYIDCSLNPFQYVVYKMDDNAIRYSMLYSNVVVGDTNAIECNVISLSEGDKVVVSILVEDDIDDVAFYLNVN